MKKIPLQRIAKVAWVLMIVLLLPAAFSFAEGTSSVNPPSEIQCLQFICQKEGIQTTSAELMRLSDGTIGSVTITGLCTAARAKGLQILGVKLPCEKLRKYPCFAIAHTWENRFLVVEKGSRVIDPSHPSRPVSWEDFKAHYTGYALLVSSKKITAPVQVTGSDLRLDFFILDFGTVEEGTPLQGTFSVLNAGTKDLMIRSLRPSCECLTASASRETVSPGGKEEILFKMDTKGMEGPQEKSIFVRSNDPITPLLQVMIRCRFAASKRQ